MSILRYSNVLGPDITTSLTQALELPVVPCIAGFDPGFQFVHEDDVVRSLRFVLDQRLRGIYNVAGDGLLPWSEIVALTRQAALAAAAARHGGAGPGPPQAAASCNLTPELARPPALRPGPRHPRLKDAGFTYLYDSPATIAAHVQTSRLRRSVGHRRRHVPLRAGRRGVLPSLARRGARAAVGQLTTEHLAGRLRAS